MIPGVGCGRNAKPFIARGMLVTGIEIEPILGVGEGLGLRRPVLKLHTPRGSASGQMAPKRRA